MQGCKKQPYPCYFKDGSESRVFIAHEHHQQHPHHVLPPTESLVVRASVIESVGAHAHHELLSSLPTGERKRPGPSLPKNQRRIRNDEICPACSKCRIQGATLWPRRTRRRARPPTARNAPSEPTALPFSASLPSSGCSSGCSAAAAIVIATTTRRAPLRRYRKHRPAPPKLSSSPPSIPSSPTSTRRTSKRTAAIMHPDTATRPSSPTRPTTTSWRKRPRAGAPSPLSDTP